MTNEIAELAREHVGRRAHSPAAVQSGGLMPARRREQYSLTWNRVYLVCKLITLRKTTNGKARHIAMNSVDGDVLPQLFKKSAAQGKVFVGKDASAVNDINTGSKMP